MNDHITSWWSRGLTTFMFLVELGMTITAAATHQWGLAGVFTVFTIIFSILFGRTWWPVRQTEIRTVTMPYPVIEPHPYTRDKASAQYQMGYEDGKADAEGDEDEGLPAGHPANPKNDKKVVQWSTGIPGLGKRL